MPKVNLSGMTIEAFMDLRKRVTKCFMTVEASLKSGWRRLPPLPWLAAQGLSEAVAAEISWAIRRDLGWSRRKTSLACCCDQGWKETW